MDRSISPEQPTDDCARSQYVSILSRYDSINWERSNKLCTHTDAMKQALAAVADMQLPMHIARYAREIRYDAVLGTLQLVDKAARQRGFAAVRNFDVISLSRVMRNEESFRRDGKRTLEMEYFVNGSDASVGVYSEHMGIDQRGLVNTHMEAINHMLWEGTTYGGHKLGTSEADKTDILAWAERGWVTVASSRTSRWFAAQTTSCSRTRW